MYLVKHCGYQYKGETLGYDSRKHSQYISVKRPIIWRLQRHHLEIKILYNYNINYIIIVYSLLFHPNPFIPLHMPPDIQRRCLNIKHHTDNLTEL